MADNKNQSDLFSSREVAEIKRVAGGGNEKKIFFTYGSSNNSNTDSYCDINIKGDNYFLELLIPNDIEIVRLGNSQTLSSFIITDVFATIPIKVDNKTFNITCKVDYNVTSQPSGGTSRVVVVNTQSIFLSYVPKDFQLEPLDITYTVKYYICKQ